MTFLLRLNTDVGKLILKRYPLYLKGNPQLRVFLPNFWMKLVRPDVKQPANVVKFITSMEMTDHDIKNYLEKIYKVPVVDIRSSIVSGEFKRVPVKGYIIKEDDFRRAFVTLPRDAKFEFPDLECPEETKKSEESEARVMDEIKEGYNKFEEKSSKRPGVPGWFSF